MLRQKIDIVIHINFTDTIYCHHRTMQNAFAMLHLI